MNGARTRLPGLTGDPAAPQGTGWMALAADEVAVPSLGDARACARPTADTADPCELRVVDIDLADGAVIVALGPRPVSVTVRVVPGFPATDDPLLMVRSPDGERTVPGRVVDSCRTALRFENVLTADDDDGDYALFLDGFERDAVRISLSLTTPPGPQLARDRCALTLSPRRRAVAPETPLPPGGIPRPPLLAVDGDGCVVRAWSLDPRGRALVPRDDDGVELRARASRGVIAVFEPGAPVRDAAFAAGGIAVATATDVYMWHGDGCAWDQPILAGGFSDIVGLGVDDDRNLVVVDAAAPNLRVFRADGIELAPPDVLPGRGWYARLRGRGLDFEAATCRFVVDPGDGCCAEPRRPMTDDEALHFRLVSDLSALRQRPAYPTRGTVVLGASAIEQELDGGRPGAHWHRVLVFGDVPAGCTVAVESRTSDDLAALHPLITTGWSRPVVAGAESEVPVASPGDTRAAIDTWVLAGPGRFLGLRLTLRGDGVSTPRITGVEIERERLSISRFLPRFFRDSTPEDDFLARWLALFETTGFDGVAARVRAYPELFDPRTAPPAMLPFLAEWLQLPAPPSIVADTPRLRRILARAPDLARLRGTADGLIEIIWLYTDVRVQIRESFVLASRFVLGTGHSLGTMTGTLLGCDTALTAESAPTYLGDALLGCTHLHECDERSGAVSGFFEVLAPAQALCSSELRRLIELLIVTERPAHTRHVLRAVAPYGWVVGIASTVGQSITDDFDRRALDPATYGIALGNGPARPAPLGEGLTLGFDSRLASAPGQPSLRLPATLGRTTRVATDGTPFAATPHHSPGDPGS